MKFTAYRFVCFVLCISVFLSLSLFSFADTVEIPTDSFEITGRSHSYISGLSTYVTLSEPNTIYSVTSNSPSALGWGGISFYTDDTTRFARGATYLVQFVLAIPTGTVSFLDGSTVGQYGGTSGNVKDIVIGSNCTISSNFDRSEFPNLFNSSDLNYNSEAYLVSLSLDTNYLDSALTISFQFDISSKNWNDFAIGYSYFSISTSEESYISSILLNMQNILYDIYQNLTSGFNSVNSYLSSIRTYVSNGFSSVLSSLSSIRTDMNNGFSELGDKLDNINQSISEGFQNNIDQAQDDLNDSNDKIELESGLIESEKSDLDSALGDLLEKIESDNAAQDQFLEDYNLSGVYQVTTFIYEALNEYLLGIQWVGAFFGVVLTFEPFAYLMYVIVFINLLLLLLNNSSFGLGRMVRGERNHDAAIQRAEQRGVERERKRTYAQERRENRRSMFDHYGF